MAEQASRCPLKACCKVCWTITGNRGECCWCFFTIFLEMLMDLQLNIHGLWMFFLQGFLGYGWCKKRKRRQTFFKNPMKSYALKLIIECNRCPYGIWLFLSHGIRLFSPHGIWLFSPHDIWLFPLHVIWLYLDCIFPQLLNDEKTLIKRS